MYACTHIKKASKRYLCIILGLSSWCHSLQLSYADIFVLLK